MTPHRNEQTAGGIAGRLIGKVKEAAGQLAGRDDLAREGRLQQAQGDADLEAREHRAHAEQQLREADLAEEEARVREEQARLHTRLEAAEREEAAERDRRAAEEAAERRAAQEQAAATQDELEARRRAADRERAADRLEESGEQEAALLEDRARAAEQRADTIDPEETS